MPDRQTYKYDAAFDLSIGQRDQQEDAIAIDFAEGAELGFIVLADGMGGHAAGDIASKIVVSEFREQLNELKADPAFMEENLECLLSQVLEDTNVRLHKATQKTPETKGMGSTLLAPMLFANRLYWISVGDSPLYLFRGSRLFRLNEDHSVASLVDALVLQGRMTAQAAQQHPDRNCLTSVISGAEIEEIDFRNTPLEMLEDDVLIAASDGLQFIQEQDIAKLVYKARGLTSKEIGAVLLQAIDELAHPDQDNVSLCILKVAASDAHAKKRDGSKSAEQISLRRETRVVHSCCEPIAANQPIPEIREIKG
ncbi:MAG: protein phosphatase 2C domain-containing protein [Pseudomonadota bacterium]